MTEPPESCPTRKPLCHHPPFPAADAWYFITICAEGHKPWVGSRVPRDRGCPEVGSCVPRDRDCPEVGSRVPRDRAFDAIARLILSAARWYHEHGIWRLSLFLVMPDHLHFIVHFPPVELGDDDGHAGRVTLPIQRFKSFLTRTYGIKCQRDFFDTRIRDAAHYAEKFKYICNNPVRKGLCAVARDWPHVIAFDRATGEERPHR